MGNGTSVNRRRPERVSYRQDVIPAEMPVERRAARPNRWTGLKRTAAYLSPREERAQPAAKSPASPRRPVRLGIDVPLLLMICTVVIFGLLMVFSASWEYSLAADGSPTRIFVRQIIFVLVGLAIAVILAWMDYHFWQKLAVPLIILTLAALIAVLAVGEVRHGAVRTLAGGSVQPSEMAKLVVIIYLAVWLYAKRDQLSEVSFGLLPLGVMLGVFSGLIFLQPDLSAAVTIVFMGCLLFFLAGGEWKQIAIMLIFVAIIGAFVVSINQTGSDRFSSFWAGLWDPTEASYHVRRSFEAFVKGGWFGVGIGNADTKFTGLPVPHTDSIFAVVGEETGVFGSAIVVALYGVLLWRGLIISRRAPDRLGSLMAAGLTIWLVMEAFVNMLVMVGLLPFAGNALPFVSAGGSNLIVSLAAIGVLFNISRLSEKSREEDERSYSAVVDLRRRDRRRSEPRPRRVAKPEAE